MRPSTRIQKFMKQNIKKTKENDVNVNFNIHEMCTDYVPVRTKFYANVPSSEITQSANNE